MDVGRGRGTDWWRRQRLADPDADGSTTVAKSEGHRPDVPRVCGRQAGGRQPSSTRWAAGEPRRAASRYPSAPSSSATGVGFFSWNRCHPEFFKTTLPVPTGTWSGQATNPGSFWKPTWDSMVLTETYCGKLGHEDERQRTRGDPVCVLTLHEANLPTPDRLPLRILWLTKIICLRHCYFKLFVSRETNPERYW